MDEVRLTKSDILGVITQRNRKHSSEENTKQTPPQIILIKFT